MTALVPSESMQASVGRVAKIRSLRVVGCMNASGLVTISLKFDGSSLVESRLGSSVRE